MLIGAQSNQKRSVLVLSGGGAKGLAHIGVLKGLEEIGYPIDEIIGTSMGSVVGAMYASGYSAAEIEALVKTQNWTEVLTGITGFVSKRINLDNESSHLFKLSFKKHKRIPSGLLRDISIERIMREALFSADTLDTFQDLPIPFSCMATDVEDGTPIRFKNGVLVDAVRASMAIPGVFAPQEINGRLYLDGGVSRNLPISEVKTENTFVVAVDVGWEPQEIETLGNPSDMLNQVIGFWIKKSSEPDRQMADILLSPNVLGFTSFSFSASEDLIQRGYEAFLAQKETFLAAKERLRPSAQSIRPPHQNLVRFDSLEVVVRNLDLQRNFLTGQILIDLVKRKFAPNQQSISPQELSQILNQLVESQYINQADYQLKKSQGYTILQLNIKQNKDDDVLLNSWFDLDNSVGFGLSYKNNRTLFQYPIQLTTSLAYQNSWRLRFLPNLLLEGKPRINLSVPIELGLWSAPDTLHLGKIPYLLTEVQTDWDYRNKWFIYAALHLDWWRMGFPEEQNDASALGLSLGFRRSRNANIEHVYSRKGIFYQGEVRIGEYNAPQLQDGYYVQVLGRHKAIYPIDSKRSVYHEVVLGNSWGSVPLMDQYYVSGFGNRALKSFTEVEHWGDGTNLVGSHLARVAVGAQESLPYNFYIKAQANIVQLSNENLKFIDWAAYRKGVGLSLGYPVSLFGVVQGSIMTDFNRFYFGLYGGKRF